MLKSGSASDYLDLLARLDACLCDQGSAFAVAPDAGNTGNGTLTGQQGGSASVAETWEIECIEDQSPGDEEWLVTGSVSGEQSARAMTGVAYTGTLVQFTINAGSTDFALGDKFILCTAPPWTRLTAAVTASSTRWRISVTSPGNPSSGLYVARLEMATSIGGTDECTGGTPTASSVYSTHVAEHAFDSDNSTYWQAAAVPAWLEYEFATAKAIKEIAITCPTTGSWAACPGDFTVEYWDGSQWIVAGTFVHESGSSAGARRTYPLKQCIWKAPGNDGTSEILVGAQPFQNAEAGWYNWRLQGYTGHSGPTVGFFSHPGAIGNAQHYQHGPVLPLWNQAMDYWFWVNGRRVIVVAKVGASYQSAYLGLIQPFASPGQWPYPLAVGGALAFYDEPNSDSTTWRYSGATWEHSNFPMSRSSLTSSYPGGYDGQSKLRLRGPDGTWLGFHGYNDYEYCMGTVAGDTIWPYAYGLRNLRANLDGSVPIFPVMFNRRVAPVNYFGVLDGVFATSGAAGLNAESEITIGYDRYLAFLDGSRSGAMDLFCVRED